MHTLLPLSHEYFAVLEAVHKYNLMPHYSTGQTPYNEWNHGVQQQPRPIPFGSIGTNPICHQKTKLQVHAMNCLYLYTLNSNLIFVMETYNNSIHRVRTVDFNPLHPAFDPPTILSNEFAARRHTPPPTTITTASPPPSSLHTGRKYPYPKDWAMAHDHEEHQLNSQNSIQWLPYSVVPHDAHPLSLTISYK